MFGRVFRTFFPSKVKKTEKRPILVSEEMGPKALALCFGEPLFTVPIDKLRYYGGLHYNYEQHHFLKYYRDGISALFEYYQSHQPDNFFEEHFLPVPKRFSRNDQTEQIDKIKYIRPWFYNPNNIIIDGEKGLGNEHGDQRFGPVTEKKIALEAERLDSILSSIKENGFNPQRFDGYPRGYFLMDENDNWTFLVRTGFHRVAALIHLGYKRIPFEFQHQHPRIVYESDCGEWASVKEGYLSKEEAVSIFRKYIISKN